MRSSTLFPGLALLAILALAACQSATNPSPISRISEPTTRFHGLRELNPPTPANPASVTAIVGATLIDGRGGPVVPNAVVIVQGDKITAAGPQASTAIPPGAQIVEAKGQSLLPGLIDSHFHLDDRDLPQMFLAHGVTSLRDPGEWDRAYDRQRSSDFPIPRLFLTGPPLDCDPPAYPETALVVASAADAVAAVNRFVDAGDSCIKIYFRIPLDWFKPICDAAHARGIPVTAHLELVDADKAVLAGLDGVEHASSFGTVLAEPAVTAAFRAAVTADNEARRPGRYVIWDKLDFEHSLRVQPLIDLLVQHKTFVSPTLAVYEKQNGDADAGDVEVHGFAQMVRFTGMCAKAGAVMVVGSHAKVPHAELGWAYQREMEVMVQAGMTPMQVITAGTYNNAHFFGIQDRLGTIEPGKTADLVLVQGDPSKDITVMRNIRRVMLGGNWVSDTGAGGAGPGPRNRN